MSVSITSELRKELRAARVDPEWFAKQFLLWKANWPRNEYSFELFGKDGAYRSPQVPGHPTALRHVHLMPLPHSRLYRGWASAFRRLGRKTSDRHLVYVESKLRGFLLIYILDEPTAHEVALMKTKDDKLLMESFCGIAEDFIDFGDVP